MNAIKVAGVMFGGIILIFVLFAGAVPMLMQAVDHTKLHNVNFAIDYLSGESYEVYALPPNPAQGQVLYYNGANWAALNPGTSGYFLQTQGAGVNPAWATATHLGLSDTPAGFAGSEGKILRVNTTPDAVEFTNLGVITVAASDSTASAKAAALASGGGICDGAGGTCDGVVLQAANDLADDTGSSVLAAAGRYFVDSTDLILTANVYGEGCGKYNDVDVGTVLTLNSARSIVIHYPGNLSHCLVRREGAASDIVRIESISGTGEYAHSPHKLLDGLSVYETDGADLSTCIHIYVNASDDDKYFSICNFGPMGAVQGAIGIHVEAEETVPHHGWVNGCTWDGFMTMWNDIHVQFNAHDGGAVGGNFVKSIQMQYSAGVTGFNGIGTVNNDILIFAWDWGANANAVVLDSDSYRNHIQGDLGYSYYTNISDSGDYNDIYSGRYHREAIPFEAGLDIYPSSDNGCAAAVLQPFNTNKIDFWLLDFSGVATEYAQFSYTLPLGFDFIDAQLKVQIQWMADVGAGGVRWEVQARAYGDGASVDQAWGDSVGVSDTFIGADKVHKTAETPVLTPASTGVYSEGIQFRIFRDHDHIDDTKESQDARLWQVWVIFLMN